MSTILSMRELATALRESAGFAHKRDIGDVIGHLAACLPAGSADMAQAVAVGDDCAAIADGQGGYLLFAIEGLVESFVQRMPWFAGWCGLMVNVSDVYAMGGRPIAVVDALWSRGMDPAGAVLEGLAAASQAYGVPVVGGHSNNRSDRGQLAVAILGRARRLITSFDARPGDVLLMAVDLRGGYEEPYPYWNAATAAPPERLRSDLELLPALAEAGLCRAGKDISMAGVLGTALMLLECSGVGARIDMAALPRPPQAEGRDGLLRWCSAFPSYGFVLSVAPADVAAVQARFVVRDIACAAIGEVTAARDVLLVQGEDHARLWHTAEPFITARG